MSRELAEVTITLNGTSVTALVAPDTTLYTFVRDQGMKSVKCACETTNCGLCTVWLDGRAVLSCAVPVVRADGRAVTTLEGLREESALFAQCLAEEGAEQCGFCSPGLIMNVLAMENEVRERAAAAGVEPTVPTEDEVDSYLAGNLCRCTGYEGQRRALRHYLALRFAPEPEQAQTQAPQQTGKAGACAAVETGEE